MLKSLALFSLSVFTETGIHSCVSSMYQNYIWINTKFISSQIVSDHISSLKKKIPGWCSRRVYFTVAYNNLWKRAFSQVTTLLRSLWGHHNIKIITHNFSFTVVHLFIYLCCRFCYFLNFPCFICSPAGEGRQASCPVWRTCSSTPSQRARIKSQRTNSPQWVYQLLL